MTNYIANFLTKFTMYQAILLFLRVVIAIAIVLSFFGILNFVWWHILGNLALFIAFCVGSNFLLSKIFRVKPNYESQYITAEILTLIVGPLNPLTGWWIILAISFAAMASKYILVYKKRHIFNPAAFGVFASALLLHQGASWWIGNRYMLPFVLIGGLLIAQKLRWFHLIFAFLFSYLATLILTLAATNADNAAILQSIKTTILDSALIYFSTVMLVEPLTAPRGKNWRIIYGAVVGILVVVHQTYWPAEWPTYGYGLETSLLAGNLLAFLLTRKTERQTLKLVEKKQENKDTYSFLFEPFKKFHFIPGQYMEWTLPHENHDSRGIRRFFTISASPTEKYLRLITKYNPKPSTFKQALAEMKPGDEIIASQLDGEFVLPEDAKQKLVFIAGGVGIAPFLSMFKYLKDKNEKRDIVFMYSNKTAEDIAFQNYLKEAGSFGVKTIHVISENPPADWKGQTGFISPEMIEKEIPDWKERTFYISGPEGMVLNYLKLLKTMGLPGHQIKRDYFPGY